MLFSSGACKLSKTGLFLEGLLRSAQLQCPVTGGAAQQSCHATGDVSTLNTCCYNNPGGQLLQTQFWDTAPATGPDDSWTLHGLWPDNCDGTYEQFCAPDRQYSGANITSILQQRSPCTLDYMNKYWKDYQGNDATFWEHEYNKHGTCISSLDPKCYRDFKAGDELVDYFVRAVALFQTLPSYHWLKDAGIVPSTSKTYTLAEIQAALKKHHGHDVIINCNKKKELNELWYHFNTFGSVVNGRFVAVDPVGSPSTCPQTGIKYLPKNGGGGSGGGSPTSGSPTATTTAVPTTATSTTAAPAPTGSGALSGKGYLYAKTGGTQTGFLISAGKWYNQAGATPATFTATPNADGSSFTLNSSKGKCAVQQGDSSLLCGADVGEGSSFGWNGQSLTVAGDGAAAGGFYADKVPSGQEQGVVYAVEKSVGVEFVWSPR